METRRSGRQTTVAVVIAALSCFMSPPIVAEFYVWETADGRRMVSTIAPQGFSAPNAIRAEYDPGSIEFQHRRLTERLAAQAKRIERARADSEQLTPHGSDREPGFPANRAPREGMMNLDELIELEKRAGRYLPPAAEVTPPRSK